MFLEMYLSVILIEKIRLNYPDNISSTAKEEIQRQTARRLRNKHYRAIRRSGLEPKFFIRVESKMNYENV
jgi:hypothetical protein